MRRSGAQYALPIPKEIDPGIRWRCRAYARAMAIRIKGLVRAHNAIRAQLRAGIAPSQVTSFQRSVQALTLQVESLCMESGTTPEALPSPSRNAYRFLKNLDFANLPEGRDQIPPVAKIHVRNVIKTRQHLADTLWHNRDAWRNNPEAQVAFRTTLRAHISDLEQACSRQDATPDALAGFARRLYLWLRYLVEGDHVSAYLTALQTAWEALSALSALEEEHVRVYLFNNRSLWRRRNARDLMTLQCNLGFLHADRKVWRAMMSSALHQKPKPNRLIVETFARSDAFRSVQAHLHTYLSSTAHIGHVHNLETSFQRVNEQYFDGALPRPILQWNTQITKRMLGHYNPGTDTVTLSITLDSPEVPPFVIDFVMYHELLHKRHGIHTTNGHRRIHTPHFRQDERAFIRYKEARTYLQSLARR